LVQTLAHLSRHPSSSPVNYELYWHSCEDNSLWITPEWYELWPLPSYFRRSHHGYSAYLNAILELPYRSLNAIVVQLKNCPFGVNTTVELKNMTTTWRQYRHVCKLKHNPLDVASVVVARWELWLVRSTTASVECSSDCESEEVWHVHVILAQFDLGLCWIITYVTFRDMPLVLCDYIIQAVWSFLKIRRLSLWKTRTAAQMRKCCRTMEYCKLIWLFLLIFLSLFLTYARLPFESWKWLPAL